MKKKLSIAMETELVDTVEAIVNEGRFRSRSHIIEYALRTYLRGEHK